MGFFRPLVAAALGAALLVLAACAGTSPRTGDTFRGYEAPREASAVIYIYAPRTDMPVLGQMASAIYLNGDEVVTIDEGRYVRFEVPPGDLRFHAATDSQNACGGRLFPGTRYAPVVFTAVAGEAYYLRYSAHPDPRRNPTTCARHLAVMENGQAVSELYGLEEVAASR